jgi:hypothetical protein
MENHVLEWLLVGLSAYCLPLCTGTSMSAILANISGWP